MPLNVPASATITNLNPVSSPRLSWTPAAQPLFDGPPKISQTLQGTIADCFVLASLVSILSKRRGASVIEEMFKDDGANVIVRLYGSGPSNALYFRVPRGRILSEGALATSRTCCWVDILEAALSVFRMKALNNSDIPGPPNLDNLDNGQAEYALKHLLGATSRGTVIVGPQIDLNLAASEQERHAGIAFINLILNADKIGPGGDVQEVQAVKDMFGSQKLYDKYLWYLGYKGESLRQSFKRVVSAQKYYVITVNNVKQSKLVPMSLRHDGFIRWVRNNMDSDFAEPIVHFASNAFGTAGLRLFPGRRKQGLPYAVDEDNNFSGITECLGKGWPVVGVTREWVGNPEGSGFSGGEDIAKGIVGGHVYAITASGLMGSNKMITLVNPWGKYIRVYTPENRPIGTNPATDTSGGVMTLDVRTVSKRFEAYCFSEIDLQ